MIKKTSTINEEFDLSLFLFIAKKSLIWILLFFIVAILTAFLYVRYASEVYESTSILQIKSNNTANKILNVQAPTEVQDEIASEVELLRSKIFLKRALSKLPLQISYYAEGTFKINEHYTNSPYTVEINVKDADIYYVPFYVNFKSKNTFELSYTYKGKKNNNTYSSNQWVKLPELDFKANVLDYDAILFQQNQASKDAFYFVVNEPEKVANPYYSRIDVKLMNDAAKTISINFKDNNARKSCDVVNQIAEEFKIYDVEKFLYLEQIIPNVSFLKI